MDEMTERSFGYTCCPPPVPPHSCNPGHITTGDWMQYINAYMDVRARQIYDKLKGMIGNQGDTVSVTETLDSGEKIANIKVNGKSNPIYAPSATEVGVEPTPKSDFETPKLIGTISVDGDEKKLYCEGSRELSFECLEPLELGSNAINVCTMQIQTKNGDEFIRIYAPQVKVDAKYGSGEHVATLTTKQVTSSWNESTQKNDISVEDVQHKIYVPLHDNNVFDEIILRDVNDNKQYKVFMRDGTLCSEEYI